MVNKLLSHTEKSKELRVSIVSYASVNFKDYVEVYKFIFKYSFELSTKTTCYQRKVNTL